ncbi:MAG TPA: hypothetical protein VF001_06170 [Candidatus Limnocylindria bacterium]
MTKSIWKKQLGTATESVKVPFAYVPVFTLKTCCSDAVSRENVSDGAVYDTSVSSWAVHPLLIVNVTVAVPP